LEGFSLPMDNFKKYECKNQNRSKTITKIFEQPRNSSFLDTWLMGRTIYQESKKFLKVQQLINGIPLWIQLKCLQKTSFEERNDIYFVK
jgi:hypothetical protein